MIEAIKEALAPPSDQHPGDWCSDNVYVENSERGERFDIKQTRWWRKPMGCYADYKTTNIVCIMPTGAGKSTFFEAINCWIPAVSPGSTLYATQTDATAKKWMKTRARKVLEKCKALDHLWPSNLRKDATDELIVWKNCFISCGGAGISNLQEQSITYGQGDEAWTWPMGRIKEWLARSHNRENRKFCLVSQAGYIATDEDAGTTSELHQEHDKCRKWEFGWKCKSCGKPTPFSFDNLKFDEVIGDDGKINEQASADTVRMVCPNPECGKEYPDTVENRRLLHDSLDENDGYICTNDTGLRGYEGFHLDRSGVWWYAWSYYVLKKIVADKQMKAGDHVALMEWTMKDRAVGWTDTQGAATIELRHSGYTEADYENARKIDGEIYRFGTLDAGGDHFWLGIRAWAEGGASKLLHFSYVPTDDAARKILDSYGVNPQLTFLDMGFESERMAGICIKHGWQGIKGDGNRKHGWEWELKAGANKGGKEMRLYNKPHFEKAKNGGRVKCWTIATESLQYILQRLINGEGAEWLCYDDAPPSYAKHLNGEYLGVDKDTRGREVPKWKRRGANHGRDVEIYSLAAALMFRVFIHTAPVEEQ